MDFDGSVGEEGVGIGIWIGNPGFLPNKGVSNVRVCSYKLAFDCSNNEAEYEALIAGLKIFKKLNAKRILVYGDFELVIKQVKGEYQAKHPRMRAYRNVVLDILRLFPDYTLTCVPRAQNVIVDSLATAASKYQDTSIDGEQDDGELDMEVNQMEVLQLKDNVIPKGLIPLEELFDQDDVAQKPSLMPTEKGVEYVNIRTTENPKMVKLSKALSP
eukprot:PITA_09965